MRNFPSWSSIAAVMLAAIVPAACETVPYTGRSQLQLISPQQENEMGVQAFQQIVGKAKLSNDATANEMVTRVGKRIAGVTGLPDAQWEYRLIQDDKQVNAFALPGGKVAVYTGILPVTKDENGLAAVLGHEIGHVVARHGGERMSQQMSVNAVVETLAGLSSGIRGRPERGRRARRGRFGGCASPMGARPGVGGRSSRPDPHGQGRL
jgi:Putative Zn-dependent protease, contains TPR repeats